MSDRDHLGHVLKVRKLDKSRTELEVTGSDYGQVTLTLCPGVLGTDTGAELVKMMADRRALAVAPTRPKPRRRQVV